jgi:hypothetical protein
MSRELDLLARDFQKTPVTVLRTELNLYQTNIQIAAAAFLREVERECKKEKQSKVTIVGLITVD